MAQTGTCKWFNFKKGFGFIAVDGLEGDDKDVFVHATNVKGNPLKEGDKVTLDVEKDDDGKSTCKNVEGGSGWSSKGRGKKGKGKGKKGKGKGRKGKGKGKKSENKDDEEEAAEEEAAEEAKEE